MKIYESAVKRPVMTALIFIGVIIFGLYSLNKIPIDLLPDIETNSIMVITTYEGASASDIETNVTRPLENMLNTVSNLKKITSASRENRSIITLEFNFGEDIDVLTNDVRDKLNMVKPFMPDGADDPVIFKFSTDMIPVMIISARADKSLPGLYQILDDNLANPLARIKGVGSVSVSGAPEREIQVYVDPVKLAAYNLTVEGLAQSVRMENLNTSAGTMDVGSETYSLRVQGEFKDVSELNRIVVGSFMGKSVYLSDVAVVSDSFKERMQESYTNGTQGAIVVVQKQSGANTVNIANEIIKTLPSLQKNLPPDVETDIMFNTAENIQQTINGLTETVLYAFIFVVLVVLFFLGRWRATIIIILTIPISLIASFIYLYATGGSLNIISLSSLSIAIGMVVDDAIVVLENITTHIEKGSSPKSASIHGTNEVSLSVVASTITVIAVFFPLTMITGMMGVMFAQLGWIVTIIITVSLICAMTLTPMLSAQMLKFEHRYHSPIFEKVYGPIKRFLDKLDVKYGQLVNWTARNKWKTFTMASIFFVLSLLLFGFLGFEFFPSEDNSRIAATIELPVGTKMEISRETALNLEKKWKEKYKELEVINFTVGQASSSNLWGSIQNNGGNIISMNLRMKPLDKREISMFALSDSLRSDLNRIPEIKKYQILPGGGNGMMGGQPTLDVEIYGYDFMETDRIAAEIKNEMTKIKGLVDVRISREDYVPEYQVEFDREKLALHGLNVATASTFLKNRINGVTASIYREEGKEYMIRIAYDPRFRQSVDAINNILIYNTQGQAVRIQDVGRVVEQFTPPTIERQNRQRVIKVTSSLSGTTMDKATVAINAAIKKVDIPSNIYVDLGGTLKDQQEGYSDLGLLLVIIIILVFIVMASQFESLVYPFIIMFSVPFGLSGVLIALILSGTTINMMSMIGFIMLVGIVVKNGIVLVDYINLNRERGMGVIQAVTKGGHSRLRPVLMTTATTILGMVPLSISKNEGSEFRTPMAISVIGGLTISTLLTLLVIPALYVIVSSRQIKRRRRKELKRRNVEIA